MAEDQAQLSSIQPSREYLIPSYRQCSSANFFTGDPEHVFAAQWTIWDGSGAQRHVFSGIGFRGTTFLPVGLKCTANTEWYHIHVSYATDRNNEA
jgi:hypothetical protein